MTKKSVPRARQRHAENGDKHGGGRPSTAPLTANEQNCAQVAEFLELEDAAAAEDAFLGESLEAVLHVCRWVLANQDHPNYDPERMILGWARKRGRGAWSDRPPKAAQVVWGEREPDADLSDQNGGQRKPRENEVLARHILKFWIERPQRFVALLDEVEAHVTGKKNGSRA